MKKKRTIIAQLAVRGSKQEQDFNNRFWEQMGHEEKFSQAWSMVNEYYLIRGQYGVTQRRLQRSVQNIKRRKR